MLCLSVRIWLYDYVLLGEIIPELISLIKPHGQFPRQLPCDILAAAEKDFFLECE